LCEAFELRNRTSTAKSGLKWLLSEMIKYKLIIYTGKFFMLLFLMLVYGNILNAQASGTDSVKAIIDVLFKAMKEADGQLLSTVFADSAVLQTIVENDGKVQVRSESAQRFVSTISGLKKNMADERIVVETIKVDGPLAMAWTPYQFYWQGKFSHCGVNSFQLVRINNQWKIQYLIDTSRKHGCVQGN
jgi:hypothetical protein